MVVGCVSLRDMAVLAIVGIQNTEDICCNCSGNIVFIVVSYSSSFIFSENFIQFMIIKFIDNFSMEYLFVVIFKYYRWSSLIYG